MRRQDRSALLGRVRPEQQATEYAVLAEIGRIISSTLNIDEIYEQFAHQVSLLIPFDRLSIAAIDLEAQTVQAVYSAGGDIPGWERGVVHEIIPEGISDILARETPRALIQDAGRRGRGRAATGARPWRRFSNPDRRAPRRPRRDSRYLEHPIAATIRIRRGITYRRRNGLAPRSPVQSPMCLHTRSWKTPRAHWKKP